MFSSGFFCGFGWFIFRKTVKSFDFVFDFVFFWVNFFVLSLISSEVDGILVYFGEKNSNGRETKCPKNPSCGPK